MKNKKCYKWIKWNLFQKFNRTNFKMFSLCFSVNRVVRVNIFFILIRQLIAFFEDLIRSFSLYYFIDSFLNFHAAKFWNFYLKKLTNVNLPYTILHNNPCLIQSYIIKLIKWKFLDLFIIRTISKEGKVCQSTYKITM